MITCDALIVTVANVCFGDGQTEAMFGKTEKATGRIREGRRARRGKKGEQRDDKKLKGVVKCVKEESVE